MSETTDRAAHVADITTATAALPAALAAKATADANLETSKEAWETARTTYGSGSTQDLAAFADYQAKLQLQRVADADVISKQAIIKDRTDKLIALPSGRVWRDAETKGSALVHGLQFMAGPLGARFTSAAAALSTLRGLIVASITPDQLVTQTGTNIGTIISNIATQEVGQIDLRQGTPTTQPVTFVSPVVDQRLLDGNL